MFWAPIEDGWPILNILSGLTLKPALEGCNVIEVHFYFLSVGFIPFDKYAVIGSPVSFYLFLKLQLCSSLGKSSSVWC
jgi:hypothetical protein